MRSSCTRALRWHFDQTDFVVSIALRDADEGSDFEFAPYVRSAPDERHDAVQALLAYETTPGTVSSDFLRLARYGRSAPSA